MKFHPAANTFPMLDKQRYSELLADIRENGQLQPITICDGMILDGRNRWKACVELGIAPATRDFNGNPWTYAWSLNGQRRDLTEIQRGAIKLLCDRGNADYLAKQKAFRAEIDANANKARSEAAKGNDNASKEREKTVTGQSDPPLFSGDSHPAREQRAKDAGVSASTQKRVEAIANHSEDMLEKLASGELSGADAKRIIQREAHTAKVEAAAAAPKIVMPGPYSIILADPPWRYDDSVPNRSIENQYPTATVPEIISHSPESAESAVLFLWATAPKLLEALEVMAGWGFLYRTNAVWDKGKIGMGYWFRGQHELLLVGIKGKHASTPECERISSVINDTRTDHSKKPECVREWIERAFPGESKLEMYCRFPREGWASWGNEV